MPCNQWIYILFLIWTLPLTVYAEQNSSGKEWTRTQPDGSVLTAENLSNLLANHKKWLQAPDRKPEDRHKFGRYNLSGADLRSANLEKADLGETDFTGAILYQAKLMDALLNEAILDDAKLQGADLSKALMGGASCYGANFIRTNLREADMRLVNLTKADLSGADLTRVSLHKADLTGCKYEPKEGCAPDTSSVASAIGLSSLRYESSPIGLTELKEAFKKSGFREQEREVTYARNRCHREILQNSGKIAAVFEGLSTLVLFEYSSDYGLSPGRALRIIVYLWVVFAIFYMVAIVFPIGRSGILVVPSNAKNGRRLCFQSLTDSTSVKKPTGIGRIITVWVRVLRIGFYFSLLSAFSIGWRELNVGNWITRLQRREYTLKPQEWVRTIAGLQSLISVYLLALWVLTYFGRPFE